MKRTREDLEVAWQAELKQYEHYEPVQDKELAGRQRKLEGELEEMQLSAEELERARALVAALEVRCHRGQGVYRKFVYIIPRIHFCGADRNKSVAQAVAREAWLAAGKRQNVGHQAAAGGRRSRFPGPAARRPGAGPAAAAAGPSSSAIDLSGSPKAACGATHDSDGDEDMGDQPPTPKYASPPPSPFLPQPPGQAPGAGAAVPVELPGAAAGPAAAAAAAGPPLLAAQPPAAVATAAADAVARQSVVSVCEVIRALVLQGEEAQRAVAATERELASLRQALAEASREAEQARGREELLLARLDGLRADVNSARERADRAERREGAARAEAAAAQLQAAEARQREAAAASAAAASPQAPAAAAVDRTLDTLWRASVIQQHSIMAPEDPQHLNLQRCYELLCFAVGAPYGARLTLRGARQALAALHSDRAAALLPAAAAWGEHGEAKCRQLLTEAFQKVNNAKEALEIHGWLAN